MKLVTGALASLLSRECVWKKTKQKQAKTRLTAERSHASFHRGSFSLERFVVNAVSFFISIAKLRVS